MVNECNGDLSTTAREFSRLPPTLRVDFACFEKNPHTRGQREEIHQLDIRTGLLDWRADNVHDDLERIQRHPPPRSECSLIGSLVAFSLCASLGDAASDRTIWCRLVDGF